MLNHLLAVAFEDSGVRSFAQLFQFDVGIQFAKGWISLKENKEITLITVLGQFGITVNSVNENSAS